MGHAVKGDALREKLAFEVVDIEGPLSECGIIDQTLLQWERAARKRPAAARRGPGPGPRP